MTDNFDRNYWGDKIDLSRWGNECKRGIQYRDKGAPAIDGTAGQRRQLGGSRKARGRASDDYERKEQA